MTQNMVDYWTIVVAIMIGVWILVFFFLKNTMNSFLATLLATAVCCFIYFIGGTLPEHTPINKNSQTYNYISHEYGNNKVSVTYEDEGSLCVADVDKSDFYISKSSNEENKVVVERYNKTVNEINIVLNEDEYNKIINNEGK